MPCGTLPSRRAAAFADYLLHVDGKAAGIIQAKRERATLTGAEPQAERYAQGNPRAGGLDHFGLHVPRAEWTKLAARLERVGVAIRGRRSRSAVYVRDPNAYTVELYRD